MARRATSRRFFIALFVLVAASLIRPFGSFADDAVFGPVVCQRGTGAPTVFDHTFSAAEPSRGYILKVHNGGLADSTYQMVSSSTITLNGAEILAPQAFNQNAEYLEVPVTLQEENTMHVEVRGKPGGTLVIEAFPLVVIDTPVERQAIHTQSVSVSGHLNASVATVSVNGVAAVVSGTNFSASDVPVTGGMATVTATAVLDGGFTGWDSVEVVLDSQPPVITVTSPPEGIWMNQDVRLIYTVTDDLDPNPAAVVAPQPPYTAEGAYEVSVTANDWAGNQSQATWHFGIDKTHPVLGAATPSPDARLADGTQTISAAWSDALSGLSLSSALLALDGAEVTAASQVTDSGISYRPASALPDGVHQVSVVIRDRAGNVSSLEWSFTVDTTPPAITVVSPAEGTTTTEPTVDLSGSVDDVLARVTVNGAAVPLAGGDFSVTGVPLVSGSNTIEIAAQDVLGNSSAVALHVFYVLPVPTATLTATPGRIQAGGSAVLEWSTEDATSVSISPTVGDVAASGSLTVFPASTTIYTLTATGAGGTTTTAATVFVDQPPATVTLTATRLCIFRGESTQLTWSSTNATHLYLQPSVGSVGVEGSVTVSPYTTTSYTITGFGSYPWPTARVWITVVEPYPWGAFYATPANVSFGQASTLQWWVGWGRPVSIEPGIGTLQFSHDVRVFPTETTTYTLTATCPYPGGTMNLQTTVNVDQSTSKLPTVSIAADPMTIRRGQNSYLSWASTDATMVEIAPFGREPLNGAAWVSPSETTTYTITGTGLVGQSAAQVTVSVIQPFPEATFSASPTTITRGESAVLSWTTNYATTVSISPELGDEAATGSASVSPSATTTYRLTAAGSGGTRYSSATVTVVEPSPTATLSLSPASVARGESATLSWSCTHASTVEISPGIGEVAATGDIVIAPTETTTYTITATGPGGTASAQEVLTVIQPVPTAAIMATPESVAQGQSAVLSWNSTNATSVSIEPPVDSTATTGSAVVAPAQTTTYTVTAVGPGGTATATAVVTVIQPTGIVNITASPGVVNLGESTTIYWSASQASAVVLNEGIGQMPPIGSITIAPNVTTEYVVMAIGGDGAQVASTTVKVLGNVAPLSGGAFGSQYEDLVPEDATLEAYDERRFAIVTGLVVDSANLPIAGVVVSVHGHPEYGTAITDGDGRYSLPVEGGSVLTFAYSKPEYLTMHRRVEVPWNSVVAAETGAMLTKDSSVTVVAFGVDPTAVTTHTNSAVIDERGSRTSTLVFEGDNRAFAVVDGVEAELSSIAVRATEFSKERTMPAVLPPSSAFTYCVDFSVDGVDEVRFEKPVVSYTENFLGFPVGMAVPVGYYDYKRAAWVPSDNGVVVQMVDRDGDGRVDALDGTGDGLPDDLNGDGNVDDEALGLGDSSKFAAGDTYWRFLVTHFSPWDCNWPYVPPDDARPPDPDSGPYVDQQKPPEESSCPITTNSYVESSSRIYHEDVAIPGTGLALNYASNRVPGYAASLNVPVSGAVIPASVKRITTMLEVAGRVFEATSQPLPGQSIAFEWDGRDYLGRVVEDHTTAKVRIGYVYDAVYAAPGDFAQAFAQAGGDVTGVRSRAEVISWKESELQLNGRVSLRRQFSNALASGWTLSNNHLTDPNDPTTVYKGDGTIASNRSHNRVIATVAGSSSSGYSGDGGPATDAMLDFPLDTSADAEGNVYVCDVGNHRVRKIDRNGLITTVAGGGTGGDGGRATDASVFPSASVSDGRGNLYVGDRCKVRRVDSAGIISTVGGGATCGYSGDGGPASQALFGSIADIAVDREGNVFVADSGNNRLRKISTNGIVDTIAGNGGDGIEVIDRAPAISVALRPGDLAVADDGSVYVVDLSRRLIRKIDASGIMTTFAGNGGYREHTGDGGPATDASIGDVNGIALDGRGNVCFTAINWPRNVADLEQGRIRCVSQDGVISTIAGSGPCAENSENEEARESGLCWPYGISIDPAGTVYYAEHTYTIDLVPYGKDKVEKISYPREAGIVSSGSDMRMPQENGEVYVFSQAGLHQSTLDMYTGARLYDFGYTPEGLLTSARDAFGRTLQIERDGTGVVTSIVSADGIRTYLDVDENGHLKRVRYPDGGEYNFSYTTSGLMTDEYDPNGNHFVHAFDGNGRVTDIWGGGGEHQRFLRSVEADNSSTFTVQNAYDETITVVERTNGDGSSTVASTGRDGSSSVTTISADGKVVTGATSCGLTTRVETDFDPIYSRDYTKRSETTLPSGRTSVVSNSNLYEDMDQDGVVDRITRDTYVNANHWKAIQDLASNSITLTSAEQRSLNISYDPVALQPREISAAGLLPTNFDYDEQGRLTRAATGERVVEYRYDLNGNVDYVMTPDGMYDYTYDAMGQLRHEGRPDGSEVHYEYDGNGNLTVVSNPNAISYRFGYNHDDQRQNFVQPLSGAYEYSYDLDRRLKTVTAPSGETITNDYSEGNLSTTTTPEGTTSYDFMCGGRLERASRNGETVSLAYDGPLVTSDTRTGTISGAIGYTYNNDFFVASMTYAGDTDGRLYDGDGQLTQAGVFTITRDPLNGLPLEVGGGGLTSVRSFSGYGDLAGQSWNVSGGALYEWSATRDLAGRIVGRTEKVGDETIGWAYRYDAVGRLLEAEKDGALVERYSYDLNGNRLTEMNALRGVVGRSYSHTIEDHVITDGADSFVFDVDGFFQSRTSAEGTVWYQYSSRGELLRCDRPDGTILTYVHDPFGRRIAKEIDGVIVEKYLWEGRTRLLAVYDGSDSLLQRYMYADARTPVAMTAGGVVYFLLTDQLGSLRAVADTSGNIVKRIDYDSFGNIIADTNPSFSVPFGFAGGLHDRDTGLVRFGYRDYSPELGRFTAKDPIDFDGGDTNLYAYVESNPISEIDPLGLARQLPLPPFSDESLSGLTKEELAKLYDQYKHFPKERAKVRQMQKRKLFRQSSLMKGKKCPGAVPVITTVDAYCKQYPEDCVDLFRELDE